MNVRSMTDGLSHALQGGCVISPFLFIRVKPSSVSHSTTVSAVLALLLPMGPDAHMLW